jgi:hypothetical protein
MWKVWADSFSTSEITLYQKQQTVIFNSNVILRYAKTWVVVSDAPDFTNLKMRIYAVNENSERGAILHTSSNTFQLSDILTAEDHGCKELYFEFPDISLSGVQPYYFALGADTASFTDESLLAWKKGFPDPVHAENVTTTFVSAARNPYDLYFIGAKL